MKRRLETLIVILLVVSINSRISFAQDEFPHKPIRMVVPFPAGGGTDVVARVLAQKMSDSLHQPVIVDNKPGANTIIGADLVAMAPADGYTVLVSTDNTWVMNQFLYRKLPYEPLNDFEFVAKLAIVPLLVIAGLKGPKTFQELMERAKANPGSLTFGFGAIAPQLCGEILKDVLKADIRGIAYKGSAGVTQGLLSDDVDFAIDGPQTVRPHVLSGKFRLLAKMGKGAVPGFSHVQPSPTLAATRESTLLCGSGCRFQEERLGT